MITLHAPGAPGRPPCRAWSFQVSLIRRSCRPQDAGEHKFRQRSTNQAKPVALAHCELPSGLGTRQADAWLEPDSAEVAGERPARHPHTGRSAIRCLPARRRSLPRRLLPPARTRLRRHPAQAAATTARCAKECRRRRTGWRFDRAHQASCEGVVPPSCDGQGGAAAWCMAVLLPQRDAAAAPVSPGAQRRAGATDVKQQQSQRSAAAGSPHPTIPNTRNVASILAPCRIIQGPDRVLIAPASAPRPSCRIAAAACAANPPQARRHCDAALITHCLSIQPPLAADALQVAHSGGMRPSSKPS